MNEWINSKRDIVPLLPEQEGGKAELTVTETGCKPRNPTAPMGAIQARFDWRGWQPRWLCSRLRACGLTFCQWPVLLFLLPVLRATFYLGWNDGWPQRRDCDWGWEMGGKGLCSNIDQASPIISSMASTQRTFPPYPVGVPNGISNDLVFCWISLAQCPEFFRIPKKTRNLSQHLAT